MVEDGATNKNTALGWPGDLKAAGHISTLADYVNFLVHNGYLSVSELHIFTNLGYEDRGKLSLASNGVLVPAFREEYSALKVYLVKKGDPADTVFLTSKNYTYNTPLNNPKAKPFGDKGFVVCNKGGDAHVFKKQQAQDLPVIGKLPGEGSVESAENCLNPGPPAPPK